MVKKITKYAKFVVCCALIVSLVAPSYAALSASDGSAFVTKAEFDAALADFNARLTTFEAGINSKIDSQVTSYLDRNGIWNGKEQDIYQELHQNLTMPSAGFAGKHVLWFSNEIIPNKSGLAFIESQGWFATDWAVITKFWDPADKAAGWALLKRGQYWSTAALAVSNVGRACLITFKETSSMSAAPQMNITLGFAEGGGTGNTTSFDGNILAAINMPVQIYKNGTIYMTQLELGVTYVFQIAAAYPMTSSGFVRKGVPIRFYVWGEYNANVASPNETLMKVTGVSYRMCIGRMIVY